MYQPLSQEQYQKARAAGFSPERIVEMEKQRKATETAVRKGDVLDRAAGVASKIPGGGAYAKSLGNSFYSLFSAGKQAIKGDFKGAGRTLMEGGAENNRNIVPIVGDAVQALATPAALVASAPTAAGRIAVNTGLGAILGGSNAAARGKGVTDIAKDAAIGGAAGGILSGAAEGLRLFKGAKAASAPLKDVIPDFNAASKTAKGRLISDSVNGAPRVNEGGIFKGRTLTPTQQEVAAAKELASVPGYKPGDTALRKFNAVRTAITGKAKVFERSLASEATIVPKKEIVSSVRRAITGKADESLLLQGSDPSVAQYLRVVENAASKAPGTPKGIWDVRKAMDAAYENARGRLAYDGDKVAALDEVHRAGRDALNNLMGKYAKNTNVKSEFQSLSNLFHAKDELLVKAQGEKGSVFKRAVAVVKTHPIKKAVVGGAAILGADRLLKETTGFGI